MAELAVLRHRTPTCGYTSIGCKLQAPCTELPPDPNNPRSGRWHGEKLECGIHIQTK